MISLKPIQPSWFHEIQTQLAPWSSGAHPHRQVSKPRRRRRVPRPTSGGDGGAPVARPWEDFNIGFNEEIG